MLEFQRMFATEDSCAEHLKALRWPDGFVCPRCGHTAAWAIGTRQLLDCQGCQAQVNLTAGTIFHRTRTPLVKWYGLLCHMATEKVGSSVAQLQRGLEIPDYKTAWLMAHKVRKAMADRDAEYCLAGLIELDEAFFGPRGTKRGRGRERKQTVLCAVALYRDRAGQERPGFAHMQVVADASARTVEQFLDRLGCGAATEEGQQLLAAIRSDGWRAYGTAARAKDLAHGKVVLRDPKAAGRLLPWVHRVISNAKAVIRGAHRGVSQKHLQAYLAEVCYRFNRRFWERELFDRLVKACLSNGTLTYQELIKKEVAYRSL